MSKFQALKTLLQDAVPAVAKEGEEAVASAIAKEAEEAAASNVAKELPMDEASRMARAEEMGFDPKQVYYHGTNTEFKEFNPFTPEGKLKKPTFISPSTDFVNNLIGQYGSNKGTNIIPVNIRANNIFDYENPEHLKMLDEAFKNETNAWGHPVIPSNYIKTGNWEEIEKPSIQRALRDLGFEGFNVKEAGVKNIGVYDPAMIRSIFAKFDPAKKDSTDFMAGLGAATLGAGALSSEAKADTGKPSPSFQNIRKQLINENSPSFGSKEGDFSSYDESEALPTEGMQGRGLATIIRNMVADKKLPGEFEEGGGGIEESTISPIDFISPQMLGSAAKGIGKGAMLAGKEAKALAGKLAAEHPELARRLMDNRGELDITPLRNLLSLKNPTKEDVLKAIEYNPPSTYRDVEKERKKLFDALSASAKERAGIPQGTENEEATRQILKLMYPEIEATNLPIKINPRLLRNGKFEYKLSTMHPEVTQPSKIVLKKATPDVGLHEAQHFRDMLINPYKQTSKELLDFYPETTINEAFNSQRSSYLIDRIKTLNPEIKEEEITKPLKEVIKNLKKDSTLTYQEKMIKLGEIVKSLSGNANDLELISAGHFHQYPRNFELQKTMELLSPDIPLYTPNLTENDKIIRDIFKQFFESETLKKPSIAETSKAIQDEYIRQNFPNISEILKNK